jgi:hypothetical protein
MDVLALAVRMYRLCKEKVKEKRHTDKPLVKNDSTITQSLFQDTAYVIGLPTIFNSPTMMNGRRTISRHAAAADKITVFADAAGEIAQGAQGAQSLNQSVGKWKSTDREGKVVARRILTAVTATSRLAHNGIRYMSTRLRL